MSCIIYFDPEENSKDTANEVEDESTQKDNVEIEEQTDQQELLDLKKVFGSAEPVSASDKLDMSLKLLKDINASSSLTAFGENTRLSTNSFTLGSGQRRSTVDFFSYQNLS